MGRKCLLHLLVVEQDVKTEAENSFLQHFISQGCHLPARFFNVFNSFSKLSKAC